MEMAREASRLQAEGHDIVRFDVGQPAHGAPQVALDAVRDALSARSFPYSEALGAMAVRRKLSDWYKHIHGLDIDPRRIALTTGASGAFTLAFLALFGDGERVALAAPGYPPYRHILTALGMRAVAVDAELQARLQLTPQDVEDAARAGPLAGVIVASPANPTGTLLSREDLAALAQACRARGCAFISDEIYHGLTYEQAAVTALAVDDEAIVINSFSKYWAMTGWRIGWLIMPERLIGAVERLAQNLTVCPPSPSQAAALAALDAQAECDARRDAYGVNRARLMDALPEMGLSIAAPPDGAFYMLVDISAHSRDSLDFCARALREAGVALTTGVDFDERRGRSWVRLAYARDTEETQRGIARLRQWILR